MNDNRKNENNQTAVSLVDQVTSWISHNGLIIFVGGLINLLLMSADHKLGWWALVADLFLIVFAAKVDKSESGSALNQRIMTRVDRVGGKVATNLQARVGQTNELSEHQQEIQSRTGGINLKLLTILLAAISLLVVFYGPFATSTLLGTVRANSIFEILLFFAHTGGRNMLLGYGMLVVLIGIPISIIMLLLSHWKRANLVCFTLAILQLIILSGVAIWLLSSSTLLNLDAEVFSRITAGNNHASKMASVTINFAISSYFLLISAALTAVVTGFNRK